MLPNVHDSDWFASASVDQVRRLDEVCRRFESAWATGIGSPHLEDYLVGWPEDDLDVLLSELIAVETERRRARGETPDFHEYLQRFPDKSQLIGEVFEDTNADANETVSLSLSLQPGQMFGAYRIVREIGRGGMGIVFEAIHELLDRRVALKILRSNPLTQREQLRRFRREARTVARLQHEAIVPIFDTGEHDGVNFIAMRFVEGCNLEQMLIMLREGAPLSLGNGEEIRFGTDAYFRAVARIGLEVAQALAHAHERGILHRDIKPSNLLLDENGAVWVTDFGLAKAEGDSATLTRTNQILGTPRYLPPEVFEGRSDVRSDLYGLGVTLYELLTRRPAFPAARHHELLNQILNATPARPKKSSRAYPRS